MMSAVSAVLPISKEEVKSARGAASAGLFSLPDPKALALVSLGFEACCA